jgi:hypothetical protein
VACKSPAAAYSACRWRMAYVAAITPIARPAQKCPWSCAAPASSRSVRLLAMWLCTSMRGCDLNMEHAQLQGMMCRSI